MVSEKERLAKIETHVEYIKDAVDEIRTRHDERLGKLEQKAAWYAGAIAVISAGLGWAGQFVPEIFRST
jgi:hypothetical protein